MTTYRARITDHWLPFPEPALRELGWSEGDEIGVEVVGDAIVLTKLADADRMAVRAAAFRPPFRPLPID